jgi:DNA-binding NarL/FixJ family response regulator
MVDKQTNKIGEPLAEFLNQDNEQYSFSFKGCESYIDALSMLDRVDIVLLELDITKEYFMPNDKDFLPWIDEDNAGYRLLAHIRNEYPDIKVIMLVDYPACEEPRSEIAEILDKGAHGYLIKSFLMTELVEEIHRVLLA